MRWIVLVLVVLAPLFGCGTDTQLTGIHWAEYGYNIDSALEVGCTDTLPFRPRPGEWNDADVVCHWPCAFVGSDSRMITAFFRIHEHHVAVIHSFSECGSEVNDAWNL